MATTLSILISSSLAGFLLSWLKIWKIQRNKKINGVEPIKNKKLRIVLLYLMVVCIGLIILGVTLFFTLKLNS